MALAGMRTSAQSALPLHPSRACAPSLVQPHRRTPLQQARHSLIAMAQQQQQQGPVSTSESPQERGPVPQAVSGQPSKAGDSPQAPESSSAPKMGDNMQAWDLDLYHYAPKWFRPPVLIIAGISFIIGCNVGAKEGLETTAMAAAPVLFGWFCAFYVLPKQFREFTRKWLKTHPEAWEKALKEAKQQLGQQGQDQQRQQRQ